MPDLRFAKGHGLGNDYIVIDAADLPWPLTVERIRAVCDRHRGAGSDGILLADLEARPFALKIYNPDGSPAEKSGNGLRIFAAYLHRRGLVAGEAFRVRLPKDEVTLKVETELPAGVLDISAEMGRADFRGEAVGFAPQAEEALGFVLPVEGGGTVRVNPVSLANPHCVVLMDELRRDEFLRLGPRLATHPAFPAGTNVQFARVLGPDRLEAWIWERGAGETLASGSSACAVAAVATRLGLVQRGRVTVEMPGGSVEVTVAEDYAIRLRGPAQMVTEGVVLEGVVG